MIEIKIDGATKGNHGISGAGVVIKHHGEVYEYTFPLGICTNHEAEFIAMIRALKLCKKQFPNKILAFQTDSQIVVDAVEKNYVKNQNFQPLLNEIMNLKEQFPLLFIKWIPSNHNKHADRLARKAIQKQIIKSSST